MSKTIRDAFTEHGVRGEYNGFKATILPLTAALHAEIDPADLAKVGTSVTAGMVLVGWNEDGVRRGRALDPFARNDLNLSIALSNGGEHLVHAGNPAHAATEIMTLVRQDAAERLRNAKAFEEESAAYEKAVGRGETPDEPVLATPRFADDAFSRVTAFIEATKAGLTSTIRSQFIGAMEENNALSDQARILRNQSVVLSPEDQSKAEEYHRIRQEIGRIKADDPLAVAAAPAVYEAEGSGEAISLLIEDLNVERGSLDPNAVFPDRKLAEEVFKVLTTTPVSRVTAVPLSPAEARRIDQDLGRFADAEWNKGATDRLNAVFAERMPDYVGRFATRMISKDDADIFLVRDRAGIVMYGWDSASRVNDLDVQKVVIASFGPDDVPSDEQMETARARLTSLQHDNGAEIDFGWGDEDDLTRGPRPAGA